MPSVVRPPQPALKAFVKTLWAVDTEQPLAQAVDHVEHVLPTGLMHLVFRLSPTRLRVFDGPNDSGRDLGQALVGGARSRFYVRQVSSASHSIGAELHPGAARALFGVSALELAERHTALADLWGTASARLHETLAQAPSLDHALELFETALLARLARSPALDSTIARAFAALATGRVSIAGLVDASGVSHRVFIERFRHAVGLTPKTYCRVERFQKARAALAQTNASLISVAGLAGYADQAHFTRDFRQIAGVSPLQLQRAGATNHVAIRSA